MRVIYKILLCIDISFFSLLFPVVVFLYMKSGK